MTVSNSLTSPDPARTKSNPTMFSSSNSSSRTDFKMRHPSPTRISPTSPPERSLCSVTARLPTPSMSCPSTGLWSLSRNGRNRRRNSTSKLRLSPRETKSATARSTSGLTRPKTWTTAARAHTFRRLLASETNAMAARLLALTSLP